MEQHNTLEISEQQCDIPTLLDHPLLEQHMHFHNLSKQAEMFHLNL